MSVTVDLYLVTTNTINNIVDKFLEDKSYFKENLTNTLESVIRVGNNKVDVKLYVFKNLREDYTELSKLLDIETIENNNVYKMLIVNEDLSIEQIINDPNNILEDFGLDLSFNFRGTTISIWYCEEGYIMDNK